MAPTSTDNAPRASPLFQGLSFYLTRSLSPSLAAELERLITKHGGVVTHSSAGATQLVDYDELDARRPEWLSADYIEASVAANALQDPAKYSGAAFRANQSAAVSARKPSRRRSMYTAEEDARMLHFAKTHGWLPMHSLPKKLWLRAMDEKVTCHPWQSMHEHFRKQLQSKTPMEQRAVMARGLQAIRDRLLVQEDEEEEKREDDEVEDGASRPSTPASARDAAAPATPATSSPPQRSEGRQQKRKRSTPSSAARETETAPSREGDGESDADSNDGRSGANGVFFRSVITEVVTDPSKRQRLQALFDAKLTAAIRTEASSTESVVNSSNVSDAATEVLAQEDEGERLREVQQTNYVEVEQATEAETDEIICQLQLETNQETPVVVHALYYCSGDAEMAKAFLKGASPSGLWSPDDDLLLVNMVSEESVDRSIVDLAVARGDFASMHVARDTDSILDRVKFLR